MIALLGLIVLIAAVVVAVAGVVANTGDGHQLSTGFTIFDQHFSGSAGQAFGAGAVVGVVGMFGLALLLAGVAGSVRRHAAVRRELRLSRREARAAVATRGDVKTPRPRRESVSPWQRFMRRTPGGPNSAQA